MSHKPSPHILTIDLEDWFHCLEPNPNQWYQFDRRVEIETDSLLKLLEKYNAKATFFVLGDVAEKCPELIRRIALQKHEIGTHGMLHQFVYTQTQKEFRDDLRKSLNLLESITYTPVRSYRAPYFSITPESFWALDILREEGILYDSSIFPIRNLRYGIPNARRTPHEVQPGLWEWPVSTLPTALGNIPFAGGVYFRFLPWKFVDGAIRMLEKRNEPVVFYLHPWEMDPDQPRYRTSSRFLNFRHYYNLDKTFKKFERVLRTASYTTITCGANMLKLEMPG